MCTLEDNITEKGSRQWLCQFLLPIGVAHFSIPVALCRCCFPLFLVSTVSGRRPVCFLFALYKMHVTFFPSPLSDSIPDVSQTRVHLRHPLLDIYIILHHPSLMRNDSRSHRPLTFVSPQKCLLTDCHHAGKARLVLNMPCPASSTAFPHTSMQDLIWFWLISSTVFLREPCGPFGLSPWAWLPSRARFSATLRWVWLDRGQNELWIPHPIVTHTNPSHLRGA